jgi:hypothetical protein
MLATSGTLVKRPVLRPRSETRVTGEMREETHSEEERIAKLRIHCDRGPRAFEDDVMYVIPNDLWTRMHLHVPLLAYFFSLLFPLMQAT